VRTGAVLVDTWPCVCVSTLLVCVGAVPRAEQQTTGRRGVCVHTHTTHPPSQVCVCVVFLVYKQQQTDRFTLDLVYTQRGGSMARRDNVVSTYLSDDEKAGLAAFAEKSGKSQSHLLREAVLEYLDHDRTARIEDEMRDVNDKLDDVLAQLDSDGTHTHMTMSDSLETARKMVRVVQRNTDNPNDIVKNDDLVEVIENYAGVDTRTIKKYKNIFRSRGLVFEHPGEEQPLWTLQTETWVEWVNQYAKLNGGRDAAETIMEHYPANVVGDADGYKIKIDRSGVEQ